MEKKYFLIGNAHLDPVWQWCVPEGLALVKSTYRSALDRMEENKDYVFTSACASYYKWVKESEPELFEEIKDKIKAGKWSVTGGMWVQPDCNIPSGESFCRHMLYSQRFFKDNFGFTVKSGYNVDSFGHNGMLPQLFKKSGIDNYVYMRPRDDGEKAYPFEENLHFWRSPDGSEVLSFRIPDREGGYTGNHLADKLKMLSQKSQPQMLFYGIGNHGGGPAREHLAQADELIKQNDNVSYSSPDEYFTYVSAESKKNEIPVYSGDLQHHASGCYSANSKIKKMNRQTEEELVYAEKTAVLSALVTGGKTCQKRIGEAWERVMFNQFHDILAGCSIKPAYKDAYNAFGMAQTAALETGSYAAERISWRINTTKFFEKDSVMRDRLWTRQGEGSPMVVFNPHSFPVKTYVSFGMGWVSGVTDSNDNDVPFQIVRAPYTDGDHYKKCMFEAQIPAYGWAVYYIFKDEQNYIPEKTENEFTVEENLLENSKVKILFNKNTGCICSFKDKATGKEYAAGEMAKAIICEDEKNDTWGHMVFDYNIYVGEFSSPELEVIENGPVRSTVKVTSHYNNSEIIQYFSLYKGDSRLYVKTKLDFREKHKICKLCFPVNAVKPKAVYSMPFGFIEKEADGLEEPCQRWCAVKGEDAAFSIINDGKYSFCLKGNELRFIAARSCAYLDHYGQKSRDAEMSYLDYGMQEFQYAIAPVTGDFTETVKAAALMNMPCRIYNETHHRGTLEPVCSGLNVSRDNIIVEAVKESEDGNGIVIRAYECAGKETAADIDFTAFGKKYAATWKPQEFKTVIFPYDGEPHETLVTEYEI
ncbi:MAG: glycosyl hydrolase-related protein [Clostridia bacterium]|nr:glycosyl hydrolase-related protein [Clostridia bacterium]